MDNVTRSPERYQVGDFVVDINASQVISPHGQVRHLKEKALKTLLVLIQEPNKFFSNEELIEKVYESVAIGTSTIAQNIKQLRECFGDADKSIFENRLKVGYRLTLNVSQVELAAAEGLHSHNRTNFQWMLILGILLVAVLSGLRFNEQQPLFTSVIEQQPLTYLKGQEYFPSLSFDQQWLLFSHRHKSDDWSLYVRQMQQGQLTPLLSNEGYSYKHGQMSRDGKNILFTRLSPGKCEFVSGQFDIRRTQLSALNIIQNCHVSSEGARIIEGHLPEHFIFSNGQAIDAPFSLFSYSTVTQQTEQLTAPPTTGRGDYFMALSPDRSALVFLRSTQRYVTEIRLFDFNKRNDTLVDRVNTTLFSVSWSTDGRALIYKNEANQILALNLLSRKKEILKDARFPIYAPFVLDSNRRIGVIAGSLTNRDIVSYDLQSQERQVLVESSYSDTLPVYSPSGSRLAWISNRTGIFQLWLKESDNKERMLTQNVKNGRFTSVDFSPDGNKLGGTFGGQWFIYDLTKDTIQWSETPEQRYTNFAWRADSQSAYILETHAHESIMKILDVSEGVMTRESQYPHAHVIKQSPDGRWLVAWIKKTHRFIRVDLQSQTEFEISFTNEAAHSNHWIVSNDQLIWIDQPSDGPAYLRRLRHDASESEQIGESPYYGYISLSTSGNTIIMTNSTRGNVELVEI